MYEPNSNGSLKLEMVEFYTEILAVSVAVYCHKDANLHRNAEEKIWGARNFAKSFNCVVRK